MGGAARVCHGPCAAGPGAAAHRGAHRIEACPFVQILDAPVQMGDHVLELLQKIVTASLVETVQVIAAHKISLDRTAQRSAARRTQIAEQLVEVPTEPRRQGTRRTTLEALFEV